MLRTKECLGSYRNKQVTMLLKRQILVPNDNHEPSDPDKIRIRIRKRLFDRFTWNTFANIMTHTYTSWYIVSLYRHRKSKVVNPTAPKSPVAPWVVIIVIYCHVFCERTCNVFPGDNLDTGRQRVATVPPAASEAVILINKNKKHNRINY